MKILSSSLIYIFLIFIILTRHIHPELQLGFDDGNIYLAFARSMTEGRMLSFSTVENPVEGFSSFLWLLFTTLLVKISTNVELCIQLFCAALLGITLATSQQVIFDRHSLTNAKYPLGTATIVTWFSTPSFLAWGLLSLMETALTFCYFASILIVLARIKNSLNSSRLIVLSILLFLLPFLRPEGFIYSIITATVLAQILYLDSSRSTNFPIMLLIISTLSGILLIFAIRIYIFDSFLPNTYYAKIGSDLASQILQGLKILGIYYITNPIVIACSAYSLVLLREAIHNQELTLDQKLLFGGISSQIISVTFFIVLSGADHFVGARFFKQVWVALFLSCVFMISKLFSSRSKKIKSLILITIILTNFLCDFIALKGADTTLLDEAKIAGHGRSAAAYLNKSLRPTGYVEVANVAIGGFGYVYLGETRDVLGLVDVNMAHANRDRSGPPGHAAFHIDTFINQSPRIFLVAECQDSNLKLALSRAGILEGPLKDIDQVPRFRELYSPFSFPISGEMRMCGFVKTKDSGLLNFGSDISFELWEPLIDRGWSVNYQANHSN